MNFYHTDSHNNTKNTMPEQLLKVDVLDLHRHFRDLAITDAAPQLTDSVGEWIKGKGEFYSIEFHETGNEEKSEEFISVVNQGNMKDDDIKRMFQAMKQVKPPPGNDNHDDDDTDSAHRRRRGHSRYGMGIKMVMIGAIIENGINNCWLTDGIIGVTVALNCDKSIIINDEPVHYNMDGTILSKYNSWKELHQMFSGILDNKSELQNTKLIFPCNNWSNEDKLNISYQLKIKFHNQIIDKTMKIFVHNPKKESMLLNCKWSAGESKETDKSYPLTNSDYKTFEARTAKKKYPDTGKTYGHVIYVYKEGDKFYKFGNGNGGTVEEITEDKFEFCTPFHTKKNEAVFEISYNQIKTNFYPFPKQNDSAGFLVGKQPNEDSVIRQLYNIDRSEQKSLFVTKYGIPITEKPIKLPKLNYNLIMALEDTDSKNNIQLAKQNPQKGTKMELTKFTKSHIKNIVSIINYIIKKEMEDKIEELKKKKEQENENKHESDEYTNDSVDDEEQNDEEDEDEEDEEDKDEEDEEDKDEEEEEDKDEEEEDEEKIEERRKTKFDSQDKDQLWGEAVALRKRKKDPNPRCPCCKKYITRQNMVAGHIESNHFGGLAILRNGIAMCSACNSNHTVSMPTMVRNNWGQDSSNYKNFMNILRKMDKDIPDH
jgi:hypothetical protein